MADNDVKIKVSLEGDKVVISGLQGIGEEAGNTDSKLGGLVKGGLAGAGKALIGLGAAAAAGGAAMSAAVIKSYADYEQNLGGIETLFKENADVVSKYADQAYQTAGLSANAYMAQVTSFSAALLQGLGGDTKAAAEYANTAMVDMSDNANKFGTDITAIQTAYQGFAKQNYTMLDNLKLGYGGTASEMARLINDSGVLGDTMTVTADTVNQVSFDKIVEAIHTVQENMDIAGTTAKEASTTIAGSIGMLRGSFDNLLTGLGSADADIDTLAGNVISSLETVVSNIGPVITNLGSNLATLGPKLGTMLEGLVGTVVGIIPDLISAGSSMIGGLVSGISSALPGLITAAVPAIVQLVQMISTQLPLLVDAGMKALIALGQGLVQAIPTLIPMVVEMVLGVVNAIIDNLPMLLDVALEMVTALATGLLDALPTLIEALPDIILAIVDFFIGAIPQLIQTGIDLLLALVGALPEIITGIVDAIPKIITGILDAVLGSIPQLIEAGIDLFLALIEALPEIISSIVKAIPQIITGIVDALIKSAPKIVEAGGQLIMGLLDGIWKAVPKLLEGIGKVAGSVIDGIKGFFGIHSPSTLLRDEVGKMLPPGIGEGVEEAAPKAIKPIQNLSHQLMAAASDIPDLVINRSVQTTLSPSSVDARYALPTPSVAVGQAASLAAAFDTLVQELRATPLTATVASDDMDTLGDKVHSAMVTVRSGDARDASTAVMKGVR